MPELRWNVLPMECMGIKMGPDNYTAYVGRVHVRFNPDCNRVSFTVVKRLTYINPVKSLEQAKEVVLGIREDLAKIKTMNQLLKLLDTVKL